MNKKNIFEFGLQTVWIVEHWNSFSPGYRGKTNAQLVWIEDALVNDLLGDYHSD